MARQPVIQIQCDRCKRVELIPPGPGRKDPVLTFTFLDKKIVYNDICLRCTSAIERIITDLEEWDRELNQHFGPTVGTNEAPPLQVAPDYTPPKPHAPSNAPSVPASAMARK